VSIEKKLSENRGEVSVKKLREYYPLGIAILASRDRFSRFFLCEPVFGSTFLSKKVEKDNLDKTLFLRQSKVKSKMIF
jgi:hypothetical protein